MTSLNMPSTVSAEMQQCISECLSCHAVCLATVQYCLQQDGKLALGCLHYLAVAAIAVGLVMVSRAPSFGRRFSLVLLGGLLGTLFITRSRHR